MSGERISISRERYPTLRGLPLSPSLYSFLHTPSSILQLATLRSPPFLFLSSSCLLFFCFLADIATLFVRAYLRRKSFPTPSNRKTTEHNLEQRILLISIYKNSLCALLWFCVHGLSEDFSLNRGVTYISLHVYSNVLSVERISFSSDARAAARYSSSLVSLSFLYLYLFLLEA